MLKVVAAAPLLVLAACATYDLRTATGDLHPLQDGRYEAKLIADITYPDGDAVAEQKRQDVLAKWMADNGYCPQGWVVESRTTTLRTQGILGDAKDIYYIVRCNEAPT